MKRGLLLLLALALGGCAEARVESAAPTTTTAAAPPKCEAPEHDLAQEPPYTATYLHRFRDAAGCEIRLDVMMLRRPGPDHHCAGWPEEIVYREHIYVRDLSGAWAEPTLPQGYAAEATPPASAVDTGYVSDAGRLLVDPNDDRWVYVRAGAVTERWPVEKKVGCS